MHREGLHRLGISNSKFRVLTKDEILGENREG
jgi:hypothetical protein